jgi:transposase
LATELDQSTRSIAKDLGINSNNLYSWVHKYLDSNQINKNNMNSENPFEENKRLRKELALVKQERDLLKKAAAYFLRRSFSKVNMDSKE